MLLPLETSSPDSDAMSPYSSTSANREAAFRFLVLRFDTGGGAGDEVRVRCGLDIALLGVLAMLMLGDCRGFVLFFFKQNFFTSEKMIGKHNQISH